MPDNATPAPAGAATERRRHARRPLAQRIKLRCPATGRTWAGRTSDLSAGGALLELDRPAPLAAGQRLAVGVARERGDVVLPAATLRAARVVRQVGGAPQRLAVCWDARPHDSAVASAPALSSRSPAARG